MSEHTTKSTTDESQDIPADAGAGDAVNQGEGADPVDMEAAALGTNPEAPGASQASDDADPVDASDAAASAETAETAETAEEDDELANARERISALEAEKADLDKEKQDYWNRALRATADLENLRKRSRREVEDARTDARSKVLREMLPVIDNLERALDHAEKTGALEDKEASAVVEGVKMVLRQFSQALERCGVTPIDSVGQAFDPNLHEAIAQNESTEYPPGSVMQALQKGYMIGDRLLRPAMVVVAKAPAAPAPAPAADAADSAETSAATDQAASAGEPDAADPSESASESSGSDEA